MCQANVNGLMLCIVSWVLSFKQCLLAGTLLVSTWLLSMFFSTGNNFLHPYLYIFSCIIIRDILYTVSVAAFVRWRAGWRKLSFFQRFLSHFTKTLNHRNSMMENFSSFGTITYQNLVKTSWLVPNRTSTLHFIQTDYWQWLLLISE